MIVNEDTDSVRCLLGSWNRKTFEELVAAQMAGTICAAATTFDKEKAISSDQFPNKGKAVTGNGIKRLNQVELKKKTGKAVIMMKQSSIFKKLEKSFSRMFIF